jgi:hypothetical protein
MQEGNNMKLNKGWVHERYKALPFISRVEAWLGRVIGKEKYQIFHNCNDNYQWKYYHGYNTYLLATTIADILLPLLKDYPSGEIRIYDSLGETTYDYAEYLRKCENVH